MNEEYTLNDVVGLLKVLTVKVDDNTRKIDGNTTEIKGLTEKVDALTETVSSHTVKIDALTETVSSHTVKIDALTETVNDVIEIVTLHSEKMDSRLTRIEATSATKDDIAKVREEMATKADLGTLQDNLYNQLLNVDKKTNVRIDVVVEALATQKIITPAQTATLLQMQPFPKLST